MEADWRSVGGVNGARMGCQSVFLENRGCGISDECEVIVVAISPGIHLMYL